MCRRSQCKQWRQGEIGQRNVCGNGRRRGYPAGFILLESSDVARCAWVEYSQAPSRLESSVPAGNSWNLRCSYLLYYMAPIKVDARFMLR